MTYKSVWVQRADDPVWICDGLGEIALETVGEGKAATSIYRFYSGGVLRASSENLQQLKLMAQRAARSGRHPKCI